MTRLRFALRICATVIIAGCAPAKPAGPSHISLHITSDPPGALAMYTPPGNPFNEKDAKVLGKTPLLRLLLPDLGGSQVQVSKAGYLEWLGTISAASPEIQVKLQPLPADDENTASSPPLQSIALVPVRVGLRKIGTDGFETTAAAAEFKNNLLKELGASLATRFGDQASIQSGSKEILETKVWAHLEQQVSKIRLEKLGFYPRPVRVDMPEALTSMLGNSSQALLLLRAEGHYLSTGQRVARVAVPLLLTAAGAVAGASVAASNPGASVVYPIFGPGPSQETVLLQVYLVHAQTRELLWYAQVVTPSRFDDEGVTEAVARKTIEQIPGAILAPR